MAGAADPKMTIELTPVDLGGRVEIQSASPLPMLDSPGGCAYVAHRVREKKTELFALVCDRDVPPRVEVMSAFRSLEMASLLHLVDWGVVDWPLDGRRRFVCVYERPNGQRLMDRLDVPRPPVGEELILRVLLPQLTHVLQELSQRGLVAGAINPTNIFVREGSGGTAVLGDCLTLPPGYAQPLIFEPLDRAMADRAGRGTGGTTDDLYALGATLLVLAAGRIPRDLPDAQMLQARMERGTYNTLTTNLRVPNSLTEVLRGLITDDPRQRWTLNDVELWQQGRRLNPKQSPLPKRAPRPLEFQSQEIWHVRAAALALATAPAAAAALIEQGELDRWLRRSLADDVRADMVANAARPTPGASRPTNYEDRLVARVCTALDPAGPLRYKGRAIMPDGFGTALAQAMASGSGAQVVAEMIAGQLPAFWINVQPDFKPETMTLIQQFDAVRAVMENPGIGFGLERALYTVSPASPCLSPIVNDWHPLTLGDLMAALNDVAAGQESVTQREPMDRHIAAFIAARNPKLNERLLAGLGAPDAGRRLVCILSVLADTQRRAGPAKLPSLSRWLSRQMDPVLKRFHNLRTRQDRQQALTRVATDGVLDNLLTLVDDPKALTIDQHGFRDAMRRYASLTRQIEKIRATTTERGDIALARGRRIAALTACFLGMGGVAVMIYLMAELR